MSISATSGLVSNIDYQALIEQLVSVQKQPIDALNTEKSFLEKVSSDFDTLNTKVTELKSAAYDLRYETGFDVFSTSVTDETILKATAGAGAGTGSYEIEVTQLAKSHKMASAGVAGTDTVVAGGAGSFKFTVGAGAEQTVSVDATTTLQDLSDAINALDAGVTASILNDGSATDPYRLVLTSTDTGTDNVIAITQNDTTLTDDDLDSLFTTTAHLQDAQDASFTVDTLAITKGSNTVTDVIPGVTLDLLSAAAGTTVTVSVTRDSEEISKKVLALIDKYNSVVSHIRENNRYDTDTKTAGTFFGDAIARTVFDDLRRVMGQEISGLPDTMNRLIHAGITTDTEGKMSLDTEEFTTALSASYDDVVNLFTQQDATDGIAKLIYDLADDITNSVDGRVPSRQSGITDVISNIDNDITKKEAELEIYEIQIRSQFAALETLLASIKSQNRYLQSIIGSQ